MRISMLITLSPCKSLKPVNTCHPNRRPSSPILSTVLQESLTDHAHAHGRAPPSPPSLASFLFLSRSQDKHASWQLLSSYYIDKEEWKAIAQRLRNEAGMDERRRPMSPRGFSKITAADIAPYIQRIVAATFLDDMDLARRRVGALLSTAKRTCVIEALSGKHYVPRFDRMLRFEVYNGRKIVVTLWYDGRKE